MTKRRTSGILLHPTSLPDHAGDGPLGEPGRRFVNLLAAGGFGWWQMLPVGPVDAFGSPYSLKSVHAGDPGMIAAAAGSGVTTPGKSSDDGNAASGGTDSRDAFMADNRDWLVPYATYECLRRMHGEQPWWDWPQTYRDRDPDALAAVQRSESWRRIIAEQQCFDAQWRSLRGYAHERGVCLFGDLPFYVDLDSADVWWERHLFRLDSRGMPVEVAGVPPDYFSEDGQWWGNPIYDWSGMEVEGFRWWIRRLRTQLRRFDLLRLDHFRALAEHWAIPAGAATAREGQWRSTPGDELLDCLTAALGHLPLVAEDLGTITAGVRALRERHSLPGMLVLQFAFDGSPDNPYLPANHQENAVVYTGTHDNNTTLGWFDSLDEHTRRKVLEQLNGTADEMPLPLIRAALESPARLAVIPLQDLLGLGSDARMNTPGVLGGNWKWRFDWTQVECGFANRWLQCNRRAGRY